MGPVIAALRDAAPQLRKLRVRVLWMSGAVNQLAELTQLSSLTLNDCHLDDTAVSKLSALSGLRMLSLRHNAEVTGAEGSMVCLADGLSQLTKLDLLGTGAGAEEAAVGAFGGRVVKAGPVLVLEPQSNG